MGMTGSGKTGLGIGLLEEAALDGIPAIIIDPKGDLGNLLLAFPDLLPSDFKPWIDTTEAARRNLTDTAYAEAVANEWKTGLEAWDEGKNRLLNYKNSVERTIYTPANNAGAPISILSSFAAPGKELIEDEGLFRDRTLSTTSSLLGLIGINKDPLKSKESVLISAILDHLWKKEESLDLASLIRYIQNPPFQEVGVFPLDTFFPAKERMQLAKTLNNLLASPGFQAWMQGPPLNIQELLYTQEGKPRHSIISIAHLSDSERMFFVTLLLNEILSWMRQQPGSSSLRSILYMDEIFGFFPSISNPPSKMPMISLLKTARAFGLGVILSTQNPIDLDYRGLGNAGTWFIGKLQTDRDRERILEGLQSASNGDLKIQTLKELLAKCKKRMFLMQSIHLPEPILFETRWTLSYLAGPLTLPQISELTPDEKKETKIVSLKTTSAKPLFPSGINEYSLTDSIADASLTPYVLGIAKLHFVDAQKSIDCWVSKALAAELTPDGKDADWQNAITLEQENLKKEAPETGSYKEIPSSLFNLDTYKTFKKSFSQYLYQNDTLKLYKIDRLVSNPEESKEDFYDRIKEDLKAKEKLKIEKIESVYRDKQSALEEKIRRIESRIQIKFERVWKRRLDAFLSILKTIISGFFSRKTLSKTNIENVGSSLKKAGSASQNPVDEENLEVLKEDFEKLKSEQIQKVKEIQEETNIDSFELITVRPKKTDIDIESIGIFWKKC